MRHERKLVQGRLAIKEHKVSIPQMARHGPPDLQLVREFASLRWRHAFERATLSTIIHHEARATFAPVPAQHGLTQRAQVELRDANESCLVQRDFFRHAQFVHVDPAVGANHGTRRIVHAFSHEIAADSASFPFQSRTDAPHGLRPGCGPSHGGHFDDGPRVVRQVYHDVALAYLDRAVRVFRGVEQFSNKVVAFHNVLQFAVFEGDGNDGNGDGGDDDAMVMQCKKKTYVVKSSWPFVRELSLEAMLGRIVTGGTGKTVRSSHSGLMCGENPR